MKKLEERIAAIANAEGNIHREETQLDNVIKGIEDETALRLMAFRSRLLTIQSNWMLRYVT